MDLCTYLCILVHLLYLLYFIQKAMTKELGADWRSKFPEFEERPFAAASIVQCINFWTSFCTLIHLFYFILLYFYLIQKAMTKELGADWRSKFLEFEERPFAAASIV